MMSDKPETAKENIPEKMQLTDEEIEAASGGVIDRRPLIKTICISCGRILDYTVSPSGKKRIEWTVCRSFSCRNWIAEHDELRPRLHTGGAASSQEPEVSGGASGEW